MSILRIIEIVLIVLLLIVGIDAMIIFNKNKDKLTNKAKEDLILRFKAITGLTILLTILNFINLFIK